MIFGMENVDLTLTDGGLWLIARKAISKKTGTRSLRAILEKFLLYAMFKKPGFGIITVEVTEDSVSGPSIVSVREGN